MQEGGKYRTRLPSQGQHPDVNRQDINGQDVHRQDVNGQDAHMYGHCTWLLSYLLPIVGMYTRSSLVSKQLQCKW